MNPQPSSPKSIALPLLHRTTCLQCAQSQVTAAGDGSSSGQQSTGGQVNGFAELVTDLSKPRIRIGIIGYMGADFSVFPRFTGQT